MPEFNVPMTFGELLEHPEKEFAGFLSHLPSATWSSCPESFHFKHASWNQRRFRCLNLQEQGIVRGKKQTVQS